MSISSKFHNELLYDKINDYTELCKRVGDIYVWEKNAGIVTLIKKDIVSMNMEMIITFSSAINASIYKYIGPTAEDIQQKQDNIVHLQDFMVEAKVRPIEQGCISFIGEDYREGREDFREGQVQEQKAM